MRGPADVDVEWGPDRRGRHVDGRECNPHTEGGGHCPARHLSGLLSAGPDGMTVARDPSLVHANPDEPPIVVSRPLLFERLAPEERASPFHEPSGIHFQRCLMAIEILTGQEVSFFEAQGVASPEADRADAEVLAGSEERFPRRGAFAGRRKELEPRLARVPGPRGEEGRPSIGNGGLPSGRRGGVHGRAGPPPPDFAWACSHDRTAARGPALQTMKNRSGARQVTITSSRIVPSSRRRCVYRARPGVDGMSFAPRKSTNAWDSRPSMKILPMWLTSKRPTAFRTVRCSSTMPAYWRGISQPANSMNRAPAFRCHS